jgi:hypothetical protein
MVVFIHPGKPIQAATSSSFSFSVAGDYGQTKNTTATLASIGNLAKSGAIAFNVGLGDLNYDYPTVSAQQWSNYVKGNLPANFPFEIVAGEHDTGDIDQLAVDLPNYIRGASGTYAQQYYFDYPSSSPLARFIFVSPGVLTQYKYNKGGADYNWVSNTIDAARAAGIRWVIVGIHKYCLAINAGQCTAPALMNLLLSKKVDLILNGQKHGYQASNQLALNSTTCASLPTTAGSYNANCVVGRSGNFTKGAGTIVLITGTGGKSMSTVDATDPQSGYFRTWMGGNAANTTWGVSQFTISANQLTEQFDRASGGNFTDSFSITASGFTPTATSSTTVTATPSPSVTGTPPTTLGQDNFQRANQTYWGNASDGQTWGANANSLQAFSISSNMGQVVAGSSTGYNAILGSAATDAEVEFTGTLSNFTGTNLGAVLRWTDSKNWYRAYIDGSHFIIQKRVNGTNTQLASVSFSAASGTSYTLLFSVVGNALSASVWPTSGGSQPGSWMVTATDSSFSSGYCGLNMYLTTGVTADITSFQATPQ